MNDLDIELNPDAVSYYDRLGVNPTADVKTIRKAGKFAFMKYAERDREAFLALRSAREALQDSQTREVYDEFCEELGADLGTRAFETWKAKSQHKSTDEIIELVREDEGQERATPGDESPLWNKLDVKDPQVVWANQPFSQSISVNLWTKAGKRLYINNLYYEGSIYLDLTSGEFYTEDYEYIPNMTYRVLDGGRGLYIEGSEKKIKIDLIGNSSQPTLWDELEIDNPELKEVMGGHDSVNVDLWTKSGKRLYINNYHERGTIYLDLLTGKFQTKNGSPLSDIYYEIQDSGRVLYVWSNSGELRISLRDKRRQRETSEQRKNDDKEDRRTEEDENRNSREGEDKNRRKKEPVTSQTWLDRRVESIRGLLEPRSTALLLLFNIGYGIVYIAAVVIAGLGLLLGVMGILAGSLGTVAWTLFALFGAPWSQAIEMVGATVGSFMIGTVSILVLEQFGIDIGE